MWRMFMTTNAIPSSYATRTPPPSHYIAAVRFFVILAFSLASSTFLILHSQLSANSQLLHLKASSTATPSACLSPFHHSISCFIYVDNSRLSIANVLLPNISPSSRDLYSAFRTLPNESAPSGKVIWNSETINDQIAERLLCAKRVATYLCKK